MAVAFQTAPASAAGTGNLTISASPTASTRGLVVFVIENDGVDGVTSVNIGGVDIPEVSGSPNEHAAGEAGTVHAFFLGSGIPTGSQTITVVVSDAGNKRALAYLLTAAADTEIAAVNTSINSSSLANPSSTLALGGRSCWVGMGLHSGQQATSGITPSAGWTSNLEFDFGSQQCAWYRFNTVGTSDVTVGWTQTAEDAVAIAVAVAEVLGPQATDDVLIRFGPGLTTTTGSGLVTPTFTTADAGDVGSGGSFIRRRRCALSGPS